MPSFTISSTDGSSAVFVSSSICGPAYICTSDTEHMYCNTLELNMNKQRSFVFKKINLFLITLNTLVYNGTGKECRANALQQRLKFSI